jgi:hypothetical protein
MLTLMMVFFEFLVMNICNHYKKRAKLRGFFFHFAGVFNPHKFFTGSFRNCHLIVSHKMFTGVLDDRWYPVDNPRKTEAVV